MTAELIFVGTELLMGQVLNTNGQYLARQLSALGISCYRQTTVGDNMDRLEATIKEALSRADILITTGGLGPTQDDITKEATARALGKNLVMNGEAEEMVRLRFRMMGHPMGENNLTQALFTEDTVLLPNSQGTAPGAKVLAGEGKLIYHLPGPPSEMVPMFEAHVRPDLESLREIVLESRYLRVFGMGESDIDARLSDLEQGANPSLSPYCGKGEVVLRATAGAKTREEAAALLDPLVETVRQRLGNALYRVDDHDKGSLAETVVQLLKEKGMTLSTAESLTGGMVSSAIVDVPGASAVLRGAIVAYTPEAKKYMLKVPYKILDQYGVVSDPCARAMAKGALSATGSDFAVAFTGLAGPEGDGSTAKVGTVYLAVASPTKTNVSLLHLSGGRNRVRTMAMLHGLNKLRYMLLNLPEDM